MRLKAHIVWMAACMTFAGCTATPEVALTVRQRASFPDEGRASACACTSEGIAYVFAGRDSKGIHRNDLWQYDPQTDTWQSLGTAPMKPRVNATMAANDGRIYIGLGYSGIKAYQDSCFQRDWWEYTPVTKQWKRLADFPNGNSVAIVSFAFEGYIYALYGFGYGFTRDIWRYSIAADTWEAVPDNYYRAKYNSGGRGTWLNGTFYFGTGYNTHNVTQWYAVDVAVDQWKERTSIPGKGREFTACATSTQFIYLFGGRHFGGDMTGGEVFDTYMRYSPDRDQWEWCGTMPCGRTENMVAFTLGGKAYFGLGENADGHVLDKLYCVEE